MPQSGVPNNFLYQVEDDTAAMIAVRDALIDLELFVSQQERRGYTGGEHLLHVRRKLAQAQAANARRLAYARWARRNPCAAQGEEGAAHD